MTYYDTHAHLDDEQLLADIDGVLQRARQANVEHVLAMATTADSSNICVQLAAQHDMVSAAVGIQPNYVGEARPGDWETIVELSRLPQVVAIGETGLDRYWKHAPWDLQVDYFHRHIQLAYDTGLPFVVHMRDCEADILEALRRAHALQGPLRGVMHSFTGSTETAHTCLELGMHISFAGMVTYKKSTELRAVAATIPRDRLLIETDAPYLSPHPVRGTRPNEPALVVHTAVCLADTRQEPLEVLAQATTENARRLFQRVPPARC